MLRVFQWGFLSPTSRLDAGSALGGSAMEGAALKTGA
jgi:hypothetical protein